MYKFKWFKGIQHLFALYSYKNGRNKATCIPMYMGSRHQFLVGGTTCKMLPYVGIWCNILACLVYAWLYNTSMCNIFSCFCAFLCHTQACQLSRIFRESHGFSRNLTLSRCRYSNSRILGTQAATDFFCMLKSVVYPHSVD